MRVAQPGKNWPKMAIYLRILRIKFDFFGRLRQSADRIWTKIARKRADKNRDFEKFWDQASGADFRGPLVTKVTRAAYLINDLSRCLLGITPYDISSTLDLWHMAPVRSLFFSSLLCSSPVNVL